jgi:hypothetical protein
MATQEKIRVKASEIAARHHLVAPHGTRDCPSPNYGRISKKPWDYLVSVCIPHIDTPEQLELCVGLVRQQTIRPYIMVIDTGSPPEVCEKIEKLRDQDLEVHYIKSHSYVHSSAAVSAALDLGFAIW